MQSFGLKIRLNGKINGDKAQMPGNKDPSDTWHQACTLTVESNVSID